MPPSRETPIAASQRTIGTRAMEQHSILDHSSASSAMEGEMASASSNRSATASVSAGIAAANAHPAQVAEPDHHFPIDGGRSLAEMASHDLDAALQLLAERAQYITGATGAAIALRRGEHNDLLCRASAGSNAPELGALLSMEYGLSGESVRTRQTMLCDDAENDPRVNREGCRQLGIASVIVMPVMSEQQVLGVFELFSGKARAFEPRDISALQRLSEIVETAVKHAVAAQSVLAEEKASEEEALSLLDAIEAEAATVKPAVSGMNGEIPQPLIDLPQSPLPAGPPEKNLPPPEPVKPALQNERTETEEPKREPAAKKPLFWSAATQASTIAAQTEKSADTVAVPPVLRNLQKCQACGFPVSHGRTLCVECEEKQWRGQRLAAQSKEPGAEVAIRTAAVANATKSGLSAPVATTAMAVQPSLDSSSVVKEPADLAASGNATLFLSSAAPPESWFAANKYILGALLVVALVIGAILWLR
jgi:hypothetical protein